jgi:hypothetical protein
MKGVSIILDETTKKRYVQIDMELIITKRGEVDDFLDLLIIESSKDEPTIPYDVVENAIREMPK